MQVDKNSLACSWLLTQIADLLYSRYAIQDLELLR